MIQEKSVRNQKGFTLVEVIVVAIIVAALAAVAVPMYTSYVTSSRENAAANAAGSVASFMGACINQTGTITTAPNHPGTGTTMITCTGPTPAPTMQLPRGIQIVISNIAASGTVTANHTGGGANQVYNY